MKKPLVTVVVITYNNEDIIEECLDSVKKNKYKNIECIVVDNCSADGTAKLIEKKYPWVHLIKQKENNGAATSRNLAMRINKGKYLIFMDSDASLHPDCIDTLVEAMEGNENIAICGPKLLFRQKKSFINSAGGMVFAAGYGADIGLGERDEGQYETQKSMLFMCGAIMMLRRSVIDVIGEYDETIRFWGCDDLDIGWRASLAGYNVLYVPQAIGYHQFHQSVRKMNSAKIARSSTSARIRTFLKNYELKSIIRYSPLLLMTALGELILLPDRWARVRAWAWNIGNLKSLREERRKIKQMRKLSDDQLRTFYRSGVFRAALDKLERSKREKEIMEHEE